MLTWVIQRARDVFPSRSSMSRDDIVERIRVPGFGIGETTKCLLRAPRARINPQPIRKLCMTFGIESAYDMYYSYY